MAIEDDKNPKKHSPEEPEKPENENASPEPEQEGSETEEISGEELIEKEDEITAGSEEKADDEESLETEETEEPFAVQSGIEVEDVEIAEEPTETQDEDKSEEEVPAVEEDPEPVQEEQKEEIKETPSEPEQEEEVKEEETSFLAAEIVAEETEDEQEPTVEQEDEDVEQAPSAIESDTVSAEATNPLEPDAETAAKKPRFKHNSFLGLITHVFIMLLLSGAIILGFFFVYLPMATHHGETTSVPDLKGLQLDSAKVLLNELGLRTEVYDSSATNFTKDLPPLTILDQDPPADGKVKSNRVIYLTVNPITPPMVEVPNVITSSVKNTQIRFKSLGLQMKIKYINGQYPNTVEGLEFEGKELTKEVLAEGFEVPKGSEIVLYVNNGIGKDQYVTVPNLVGMPLDEAEWMLMGMGLAVGKITYVESNDLAPGTVVLQNPNPENRRTLQIGSSIAVALAKEIEDEEKKDK